MLGAPHPSLMLAARAISQLPRDGRQLLAVDGVDGAGKTTFADQLATMVERPVVRASCDAFHNDAFHRYRLGRESPEGFYLDSFNYDALAEPSQTVSGYDHTVIEPGTPAPDFELPGEARR